MGLHYKYKHVGMSIIIKPIEFKELTQAFDRTQGAERLRKRCCKSKKIFLTLA